MIKQETQAASFLMDKIETITGWKYEDVNVYKYGDAEITSNSYDILSEYYKNILIR